jgi:hypothetical protein
MTDLQAPQGINPERKVNVVLTRDFKVTVAARVQSDPALCADASGRGHHLDLQW